MINLQKFLNDLRDALGWPYSSPGGTGADCSQSGIDCSGMAVRAFRLQGDKSLYHGCNTMWHDGTFSEKGVLSSVNQLNPGYAVLLRKEWRKDNEDDKKNKWYLDPEGNMSHIGYVLSVNPLEIVDASYSAGKVRITNSIKKVGWNRWGRIAKVDYNDEEVKQEVRTMQMVVKTPDGGTLNIRKAQKTTSDAIAKLPDGTIIEVVKDCGNGWCQVIVDGKTGYCLAKYLDETENITIEQTVAKLVSEARAHGWRI